MVDALQLYDQDFLAWTQDQAAALRDAARHGTNLPVDWENVAEEIESLGKSLRRELRNRIRVVLEHLLKLEHSASRDPRAGWMDSVDEQRSEIRLLLEQNPSLRREVAGAIEQEFPYAAKRAADALQRHAEANAAAIAPSVLVPYTAEQVLGDWWPGQDGAA